MRSVNRSFHPRAGMDDRYNQGSAPDGARGTRELPGLTDHTLNPSQVGSAYVIRKPKRESCGPFGAIFTARGQGNLVGTNLTQSIPRVRTVSSRSGYGGARKT